MERNNVSAKRIAIAVRALEAKMPEPTKPGKRQLPDWLVKAFVEQGARVDASGNLDLESIKELSGRGIDHTSDPDPGSPGEV
jgi:hypothetical protein